MIPVAAVGLVAYCVTLIQVIKSTFGKYPRLSPLIHDPAFQASDRLERRKDRWQTGSDNWLQYAWPTCGQRYPNQMQPKRFKVDARAVLSLGRESIRDHVTAVVELVKNSYDAGSRVVEIELSAGGAKQANHFLRISDDGSGMDETDVEAKWLRIGYSEKLTAKKIGTRRRLGEKGVGRLSADRLGAQLHLRSQAKNKVATGIHVDWSDFETGGKDLSAIDIEVLSKVSFIVPQPSPWDDKEEVYLPAPSGRQNSDQIPGTELVISGLRQEWMADDVTRLRGELSQLINPFDEGSEFQIRIITDLGDELCGVLTSPEMMDGEIEGVFKVSKNKVSVTELTRSAKSRKQKPRTQTISLAEFLDFHGKTVPPEASPGEVEVRIRLYNVGEGLTAKATKSLVMRFLDQNSGVRVYRDRVRVLPYGDPEKAEGDWLELAQRKAQFRAAISRKDWRVESNRIVGVVLISRDANPNLSDAAGREGLIENQAFRLLRTLVLNCVRHVELAYQSIRSIPLPVREALQQPKKVVRLFNNYVKELGEDLRQIEKSLPKTQGDEVKKVREKIQTQERKSEELSASLTEILDQALTYRGLATLGIAHASFGHEIQLSAGQFIDAAHAASLELNPPPNLPKAKRELEKAINHGKRISTWGAYTLTRVKATKRRSSEEPLQDVVSKLIKDLVPFFEGSGITLKTGVVESIQDKIVPMDFESLLINLLTNAYDFVKDSSRSPRKVEVNLRKKTQDAVAGYELRVGDSGPGVAKHIRNHIWAPLFTTKKGKDGKPNGTGLGLSIVDNIVKELNGTREVETDTKLGGAQFIIWLPFHLPS